LVNFAKSPLSQIATDTFPIFAVIRAEPEERSRGPQCLNNFSVGAGRGFLPAHLNGILARRQSEMLFVVQYLTER
jgi:hypothetical protein